MQPAFTLAEVLIVLGIIGLIADMTIPTLVQSTQEKVAIARLQKAYSTLENAYRLAVAENGLPDGWGLIDRASPEGAAKMIDMLAPNLKLLKNCGVEKGCFPDVPYKDINGNGSNNINNVNMYAKAQLADGTLLAAVSHSKECEANYGTSNMLQHGCGDYWVDINGIKGPNQYGVDTFLFWLTKDGVVPMGTEADVQYGFDTHCKDIKDSIFENGIGCAAWVIYNGNMDYLHCDDLSWSGKKKCK